MLRRARVLGSAEVVAGWLLGDQDLRPSIFAPKRMWWPTPLHARHLPNAPLKVAEWDSFERLHCLHFM